MDQRRVRHVSWLWRPRIMIAILTASALVCAPHSAVQASLVSKHLRKLERWTHKRARKVGIAWNKFRVHPVEYVANLPLRTVLDVCSAPIQYYEGTLRNQARGRWQHLPENVIAAAQPFYAINLKSVEIAEGVRTTNGDAQTFGSRIYFPTAVQFNDPNDVHWLLHEMEHVVQFRGGRYGQAGKLCEYMAKAVGSGLNHDQIDMERAAENKANAIINPVMFHLKNGYPQPLPASPSRSRRPSNSSDDPPDHDKSNRD